MTRSQLSMILTGQSHAATQVVGISDMKVSSNPADVLVTYSIGSCIGLSLYDPVAGIGGLAHCMLPLSRIDALKARENPYMFTDTGVQAILQAVFDLGARRRHLVAKLAGGSRILDERRLFNIGEKNYFVARKVLWKNNILISAEDVGGHAKRTLSLYVATGRTTVRSDRRETDL